MKIHKRKEAVDYPILLLRKYILFAGILLFLNLFFGISVHPARAAITLVATSTSAAGGSTAPSSSPMNDGAGNLLVVTLEEPSLSSSSITDSAGDTFLAVSSTPFYNSSVNDALEIFYAENIKAQTNNVVTSSQFQNAAFMSVLQYAGAATSSALDAYATGTCASSCTTMTTNSFSNSASGDVEVGVGGLAYGNSGLGAGTNFTVEIPSTVNTYPGGITTEDYIGALSGPQTASFLLPTGNPGMMYVASFRSASAPQNPPTISSFSFLPGTIDVGSQSVLSWSVTNASSVSISGNALNLATSTLVGSTAITTDATGTFTYTLTALNANGSSTATTALFAVPSTKSIYISQAGAGGMNGGDCADALPVSFLNNSSNWGTGVGQIGPGVTAHLCGVITSTLTMYGSGTPGNDIEIKWEPGARISQPVAQAININGASSYLLFDGGIPCGPGTACDAIEAANMTGYATGQTGIIEATANGSALANQIAGSQAFFGCAGCHNIEIENLIIRNLYIHSSASDTTNSADAFDYTWTCVNGSGCGPGIVSIHDSTIHDNGNAININETSGTTVNIYNDDFYQNNWGVGISGSGTRTVSIYDNHFHDTANWDTTTDAFHHNGVHIFMNSSTDSMGINIYNNLSDGNWGSCCSTATQVYVDTNPWQVPDDVNVFNNACIQSAGNSAPCLEYGALTGLVANNTLIGVCTGNDNTYGISIGGSSTAVTVQNNIVQCYSQYFQLNSGAGITAWDYNTYGPNPYPSGAGEWDCDGVSYNTFTTWQSGCHYDTHGQQISNLNLSTVGIPQAGSPVIDAGANLTSYGILALDSDAAGVARPSTGAWDAGAFQYAPPTPSISSFSASPSTLTQGSSATLSWSVTNASSVVISGDALNITTSTLSGSISVIPATTGNLTYILAATNAAGTSTAPLTLTVNAPVSSGAGGGGGVVYFVGGGGSYFAPSPPFSTASSSSGNGTLLAVSSSTIKTSSSTPLLALNALIRALCSLVTEAETQGISLPASASTLCGPPASSFTKNLHIGMRDPEVRSLQHYLNTNGFPVVSVPTYAGSPGYETEYFGMDTKLALEKFQASHGIPATGYFGPITRAWIAEH